MLLAASPPSRSPRPRPPSRPRPRARRQCAPDPGHAEAAAARRVDRERRQHRLAVPARAHRRPAEGGADPLVRRGRRAGPQRGGRAGPADRRRVLAVAVRAVVALADRHAGPGPRLRPARVRGRRRRTSGTWSSTAGSTRTGCRWAPTSTRWCRRIPARVHPDWVLPYGGKLYYNPGIPEVRQFTIDAIMDAVRRYDIDAVHFDDYFYPYPVAGQTFDDAATYARVRRRPLPRGLAAQERRLADLRAVVGDPVGEAVGAVRHQPVRDLAQRVDRPGGLPDAGRRADLRRPVRGHGQVGARGVDRLHRAAGVLEHRVRGGGLREARAVVVGHRGRHGREPLHRAREPQGGEPGAARGVAGPERDEPAADVQPGLPAGARATSTSRPRRCGRTAWTTCRS